MLDEGEAIFVPHGYWHMVVNLEDSIALTHNYVSSSNLGDVLHFLRHKCDQVSGVRDRQEDGAVQPERLYEVFTTALKQHDTALLEAGLADEKLSEAREKVRLRARKGMGEDASLRAGGRVITKAKHKAKTTAAAGNKRNNMASDEGKEREEEGKNASAPPAFSFAFSF